MIIVPKYPEVKVDLSGVNGNAFVIMGRVCDEMKRAGVPQPERVEFHREATSGDYDNLIQVVLQWVTVV